MSRLLPAVIADTAAIRRRDPADILTQDATWIRGRFGRVSRECVAVVIPARDEEHDLPATLLALARSTVSVVPIVVDNGSQDDTGAVAAHLGARVVSAESGAKMAATQAGLRHAITNLATKDVLFTDADTLVLPAWAETMRRRLAATARPAHDPDAGGLLAPGTRG
ncbi:MAG TPA: glycosyltransferase family A protein [Micromonosporaceae bacterium]